MGLLMTGARIGARGEKKSSAPDAPAVAAAAAARSATSAAAPRGESPRLPAASAIEAGLMAGHFDLRAREAGRRLRSSSASLFRGWAVAFKWGRQLGGGRAGGDGLLWATRSAAACDACEVKAHSQMASVNY